MSKFNFNTRAGKYTVALRDTGKLDEYDKHIIEYSLVKPDGTVLFAGSDLHTSPLHKPAGRDSAIALLGFLTLRKGDTDAEYFDKYTPKQLEFSESADCDDLSLYVNG